MPTETQSSHKKFELQRYPSAFFRCSLLWARFLKQKDPNLWKSPKKNIWGRCWTSIGLRITQADVWFEAARFRVLDRPRNPTTASRILNGVRSLGAPTHRRVGSPSSHTGRCHVSGAGQAYDKNNTWPLVCTKKNDTNSPKVSNGKK